MTRFIMIVIVLAAAWHLASSPAVAVSPTAEEMAKARQWATRFEEAAQGKDYRPPFSFIYNGKPSAELLQTWNRKQTTRQLDGQRSERTTTWTDPKTGLEVACISVECSDFPGIEWTVWFRTPARRTRRSSPKCREWTSPSIATAKEITLCTTSRGDDCSAASYRPIVANLGQRSEPPFRSGRRKADKRNLSVFQRGMVRPGSDCRAGLAGTMGGPFRLRTSLRC